MIKKKIYIKTFGCSINQSDSELMGGLLKKSGFIVISEYGSDDNNSKKKFDECCDDSKNSDELKNIDVVIINTCTVKNLAESKFFRELRFWKGRDAKIIVTGCIPQAEKDLLKDTLKDVSVIGTRQLTHIVDAVNMALNGKIMHNIDNDLNERLNLPKVRKIGIIEIIPISEGCMSKCAFCKTKYARGELLSYPKEKIIAQFKSAISDGCKEFWITSQDNGCYGFDIYRKEKYFLPQLLDELLALDADFRIRLGMSNPDHIDRIKEDLVETFKHPKMFKFLHIPVQSGNDKVLRTMKRPYTIKKFCAIIELFRKKIPEITISTDLIAGFPEESDEEFNDTLNLVKNVRFDVLNFSRFWLRKGTFAETMNQLPNDKIKERTVRLKNLFNEILESKNSAWINREMNVLVDEFDANEEKGFLTCRNDQYKQVRVSNHKRNIKLGDFMNVRITRATKYYLIGDQL